MTNFHEFGFNQKKKLCGSLFMPWVIINRPFHHRRESVSSRHLTATQFKAINEPLVFCISNSGRLH